MSYWCLKFLKTKSKKNCIWHFRFDQKFWRIYWHYDGFFFAYDVALDFMTYCMTLCHYFHIFRSWRTFDFIIYFLISSHTFLIVMTYTCLRNDIHFNIMMYFYTFWHHDVFFNFLMYFFEIMIYFLISWRTLGCYDVHVLCDILYDVMTYFLKSTYFSHQDMFQYFFDVLTHILTYDYFWRHYVFMFYCT